MRNMSTRSEKVPLFILVITAFVCSRTMFLFIDDSEGPNLLVVSVVAAIVYVVPLAIYLHSPVVHGTALHRPLGTLTNLKRLAILIGMQLAVATTLLLLS